uniref:Uncharacterized protein n=1 Tax=Arundo donax TaxID=35708 RepID=A0A0A9EDK6_ARUDO
MINSRLWLLLDDDPFHCYAPNWASA